ncbi:MAG: O-antigen ligase family protein [Anaerolineaceae bacterium]|nr:O-antigen ligase family protein [Anaerolineaceae bacterium]
MLRSFDIGLRDNWRAGIIAISLLLLIILIIAGQLVPLALVMAVGIGVIIASQFPMLTVISFLLVAVYPTLFMMTPNFNPDYGVIGGGLFASDVIVICMAGAIILQVLRKREVQEMARSFTGLLILFFSLWLAYEIIRNYPVYGLSAPGEFRFRYLILIVPVYIGLFFPSAERRRGLFRLLIFSALILTLCVVPVIGTLKGWGVGPENRFFPSHISLGLVYGLIALLIARKYGMIRISAFVIWIICIPILVLVLVDSHRSVWVAGVIALAMLIWLKEFRLSSIIRYLPLVLLVVGLVFAVATTAGLDVPSYIISRASEIITPEATNGTAAWRLNQWDIEMQSFNKSPVQGIGFGGYWITGVEPHSLYVQTLVKLGAVGLFLYIAVIICLFFKMFSWFKVHRKEATPELAIVVVALTVLVAGHAYYSVYALEAYTWLFVGLGMANSSNRNLAC